MERHTPGGRIRVFLVDDHPVVRAGFALGLDDAPDMQVVGQADTAADALESVVAAAPNVVLVDLSLPDRDGVELLGLLRELVPKARLVVLSASDEESRVAEALRAGAHGYLHKGSSLEEIVDAVRRSAAGEVALSPRLAGIVVRAMRAPVPAGAGSLDLLTAREQQVLELLVRGMSTRDAGAELGISAKTVETHRVRIYAKLGCRTTVELTRFALRSGLIQP